MRGIVLHPQQPAEAQPDRYYRLSLQENPQPTSWGLETCLVEMALHKHKGKRWLKTHTQLQTGSYKPNGSFEIENWLALLLSPGMHLVLSGAGYTFSECHITQLQETRPSLN